MKNSNTQSINNSHRGDNLAGKIEKLHPHYKTVLQALRYGLEVLERDDLTDKQKVGRAKHQIKDAMHMLGYTEELVRTYRKPSTESSTET